MPKFEVELDGKRFEFVGDKAPTEAEARREIGKLQLDRPPETIQRGLEREAVSKLPPSRNVFGLPGPTLADIPGVATNILDAFTIGAFTGSLERPKLASILGPGGPVLADLINLGGKTVNLVRGRGFEGDVIPPEKTGIAGRPKPEPPLQPVTPAGKVIGTGAGILAALLGPGKLGFRATKSAVKATAGKVPGIANATVKDIEFAERVQNTAFQTIRNAGTKFGDDIAKLEGTNPTEAVDITEAVTNFAANAAENADIARRLKAGIRVSGSKKVKEFFDQVQDPNQVVTLAKMTLKESQEIVRAVQKAPNLISKFTKGKLARFDPNEIAFLEFINDIRAAQLQAFPQFANTLKSFSETMQKWRQVKNFFKAGKTIGAVKGKFGDPQLEKMAFDMLSPAVIKSIGGVRNVVRIANGLKWVGIVAGGSAVAGIAGAGALSRLAGGQGGGP